MLRIIFVSVVLLFNTICLAQNKQSIDSLKILLNSGIDGVKKVKVLNALGNEYKRSDTLKTVEYTSQAIKLAQKINYLEGQTYSYYIEGWAFMSKRNYKKARNLFKKAIKIGDEISDKKAMADAFMGLGAIAYNLDFLDEALENYFKALKLSEELGYKKGIAALYNNIANTYMYKPEYGLSEEYFLKAINMHQESGNKLRLGYSFINLGELYFKMAKYNKSNQYFFKAKDIFNDLNIERMLLRIYKKLGSIQRKQGFYQLSLDYLFESLTIAEKLKDENNIGIVCNSIGIVFYEQNDFDNALVYYRKYLRVILKLERNNKMSVVYSNLGLTFYGLQKYDSAEYYFNKCIKIAEPINSNFILGWSYYGLFKTFNSTNRKAQAKDFLFKSIKLREKLGRNEELAQSYNSLAKTYLEEKKYVKALKFFKESEIICKEIENPLNYIDASVGLSNCYEKLGNNKKALEYHKLFKLLSDSLINEKNTKELTEKSMQYEFDKEKNIIEAENEKEVLLQQKELEYQKKLTYSFVFGFGVLIIFSFNIYRNYKQKILTNKILVDQKEEITNQAEELKTSNEKLEQLSQFKESLTSMIVHDLKNPINAIIGLSRNFIRENNKLSTINNSGKKMMNLVLNILDVQKFEETKFKLIFSNVFLSELVEKAIEEVSFLAKEKNVDLKCELKNDYSLIIDFDIIIRVMVNIISNAIKYSDFNSTIIIRFSEVEKGILKIFIKDEGRGIPADQVPFVFDKFWQFKSKKSSGIRSVGLGLTFCKMAVEAHDGKIAAASEEGEWTEISFTVPFEKEMITVRSEKEILTIESEGENSLSLSVKSQLFLKSFVEEISAFQSYETTEILNVLYSIKNSDPMVSEWKEEVENSVVMGNVSRFDELLEMVS